MGVSLKEIGVSSLKEARFKLKYKQCHIDMCTNDKKIGCATASNCPHVGTRFYAYACTSDCFRKCKLNRYKK